MMSPLFFRQTAPNKYDRRAPAVYSHILLISADFWHKICSHYWRNNAKWRGWGFIALR